MDNRTIVVADDDRLVRVTLASGLRGAGYQVLEAGDGEEALTLAETADPALAILDLRMPRLSGIETARRLRDGCGVPCMFLSAYDDLAEVKKAVDEGALGYLVKPMDVAQILPAIETALGRAAEIDRLRRTEAGLNKALSQGRETSVAIGILMERHHLGEEEAFEALRAYARSQRRRLSDVALQIVQAVGAANVLTTEIAARAAAPGRAGGRDRAGS